MGYHEKWRRVLVLLGLGFSSIEEGYIVGHTSSMVAGLYAEKDQLKFTDEDISWITSIMFSSMFFGGLAATLVTETEKLGRRYSITLFNVPIIIHWIILYFARDKNVFLAIRFLIGFCFGATIPIVYMATGEYSAPKVRGANLAFITAMSSSLGGSAGHLLGIAYHWRTASLLAIIPALMSAVILLFCVESPSWLAYKGKFEEAKSAFRALHGRQPLSEKEMHLLIEFEKTKYNKTDQKTNTIVLLLKRLKFAANKRYFWSVMLICSVVNVYKLICGKILYNAIGVTMLQHIASRNDVLILSMIIDAVIIIACGLSSYILRVMKIRPVLFTGGVLNNVVLAALSISLYLTNDNAVHVCIDTCLYGIHFFVIHAGLYPILETLPSELYPLEIKFVCVLLQSIVATVFVSLYVKVIPSLFLIIDYYGVFMMNVTIMLCFILILWIKLPETKGRTLQEIELYFKKDGFLYIDEVLNEDQMKDLMTTIK